MGASAGGLEAFRQLLGALPVDTGMAYVLVQHLDARHDSILADLLARGSLMPVSEVTEDTPVEANHVYVTPGQQDVAIQGNVLTLVPRTTTRGQHMPIDSFLHTLAEARGNRAIAVILSGTGSDGTLGAKAIKAEGGIAFAQDPASAAYDGMPRSAIGSGCVDFVLPPQLVAQELSRLSRHPYVNAPPRDEPADEPTSLRKGNDGLAAILAVLRTKTGTDFSAYKPPTVKRRIARRMALARIETLDEYANYLRDHADEVQALKQDCLITVTSFFRDPEAFQVLRQVVLPRLVAAEPRAAPVRVWVPGCATGEEVYSIVICLLEGARDLNREMAFQVFGTDLSESALERARAGRYLPNIARDVSPERLQRFFDEVDGHYQVTKAIRDMCVFARHDVTRDPPFGRMDLISCRNMLIYLDVASQQRMMALFHYALLPWGFLLLGASETASATQDLFAPVDKKHRIYSKRPAALATVLAFASPGGTDAREQQGPVPLAPGAGRDELLKEADRLLLARYAPAGVIVDGRDNIIEFRGQTDPYLEHAHGRASLSLLKMARKELLLEVRQAIQEARKKEAPVRKEGIFLKRGGHVRALDLEVVPLKWSPEKERSLLVLFEGRSESTGPGGRPARRSSRPDRPAPVEQNEALQHELAEAKHYLQAVLNEHEAANEDLQASNEEILSANEELQSINEELESAKEELQSTNEELTTLNQEMRDRNLQLGHALEYANGIVETVRTPLLILDSGLRVEKGNRSFYDFFGATPEATVGRLVYELGHGEWDIPALRRALEEILPADARVEDYEVDHEFPLVGRRILTLNARKLRHERGRDNILISFEDRTEIRRAEKEREALLAIEQQARKRAEQTDKLKDEFVATLSHELRGPLHAMVGWVQILRAAGIDDATKESGMAAIERSVKAQERLIADLLDYSRMAGGKLSLAPRTIDLMPVAEAAIGTIRSAAEAKQIRLDLATDGKPPVIHGDPDRLQQVLWNLLSNAVKFTPRRGRVKVWIGRAGSSLHVRVSDNGQGISARFLPHVFERFRQEEASTGRMEGGLGLGLAIVKELVELHGGTVRVESPGEEQGTTVTVKLPIPALLAEPGAAELKDQLKDVEEAPEAASPKTSREELDRSALKGVRLLVVDDEPDSREMLARLFEHCGAVVRSVASSAEALDELVRTNPDALVSDIGLPGEDGYELIRKVRNLEAERGGGRIPALALTAYAGSEDRARALAAGFDLHVPKPVSPSDLLSKTASLIASRRQPDR